MTAVESVGKRRTLERARLRGAGERPRSGARHRYCPNVELVTHEGRKVRFYDDLIKDKIVVTNFMYAQCEGICPAIISNLLRLQKLFGVSVNRDIYMYSITLTPQ